MYNPIKYTSANPDECFQVRIKSVTVGRALMRAPTHIHNVTENGLCFLAKFVAKVRIISDSNGNSVDLIRFEREGQYA